MKGWLTGVRIKGCGKEVAKTNSYRVEFLREARAELSAKDEQERREDISAEEMRQ